MPLLTSELIKIVSPNIRYKEAAIASLDLLSAIVAVLSTTLVM